MSSYRPADNRYEVVPYRRCGRSGLKLPAISLGLWHNFGDVDRHENSRAMVLRAFDLGITHLDLANNYGPPPGSAERTFGRILREDLGAHRDELIISTKAGYTMWPGPYGDWGSRKYLLSSLDQSLSRMGLEYVDIFYSHRPDPETPLEETMCALAQAIRQGKALYAGLSNYPGARTREAAAILRDMGVPLLIHQPRYNMLGREPETDLFPVLDQEGIGCIPFCPLAQGLLTDRYLDGIPDDSRASKAHGFLKAKDIDAEKIARIRKLASIARDRGQSLAQMALAWVLRTPTVTTALIGASKVEQIEQNISALEAAPFTAGELAAIDAALA